MSYILQLVESPQPFTLTKASFNPFLKGSVRNNVQFELNQTKWMSVQNKINKLIQIQKSMCVLLATGVHRCWVCEMSLGGVWNQPIGWKVTKADINIDFFFLLGGGDGAWKSSVMIWPTSLSFCSKSQLKIVWRRILSAKFCFHFSLN